MRCLLKDSDSNQRFVKRFIERKLRDTMVSQSHRLALRAYSNWLSRPYRFIQVHDALPRIRTFVLVSATIRNRLSGIRSDTCAPVNCRLFRSFNRGTNLASVAVPA